MQRTLEDMHSKVESDNHEFQRSSFYYCSAEELEQDEKHELRDLPTLSQSLLRTSAISTEDREAARVPKRVSERDLQIEKLSLASKGASRKQKPTSRWVCVTHALRLPRSFDMDLVFMDTEQEYCTAKGASITVEEATACGEDGRDAQRLDRDFNAFPVPS